MVKNISILIVDDSESARLHNQVAVKKLFEGSDELNIRLTSSAHEMFQALKDEKFHVILLDRDLGEDENEEMVDGISLIPDILEVQPSARVLVITSFAETQLAVKAMENGAVGFITKGLKPEETEYRNQQILKALRESQFEMESLRQSVSATNYIGEYIYRSEAMRMIDIQLNALSEVHTPVLFLGESGLGKTHAAKRLNELSRIFYNQKERVFANVNINALPESLIESELFGHEKGAFTGATSRKQGLFEIATGGDILLDEIGDASLSLQGKLLKFIEEKSFRRLGGQQEIKTNARIIFATNKDLDKLVSEGKFRNDFYARICTVKINMPGLNERKEDIPYICQKLSEQISFENNKNISYNDFPPALKKYFQRDDILFNIRGIKNDIERLMIFCPPKNNRKIDYSCWKSILGDTSKTINLDSGNEEDIDILIDKLMSNLGKKSWPGLPEIKNRLEANAFKIASKLYNKNKDMANVLGLSESVTSTKLRKYVKHGVES